MIELPCSLTLAIGKQAIQSKHVVQGQSPVNAELWGDPSHFKIAV